MNPYPSGRKWRRRCAIAIGATALAGMLGWLALPWVPLPTGLGDPSVTSPPTELMDRHGTLLRVLPGSDGRVARDLAEADVPRGIVLATLAAEDARFRSHPGFDLRATLRAAFQWVRHGRVVSGASTITQQLVKLAEPRPRTLRTKLVEALLAARLEREWDKDRILRAYLARIDYGNRCAGLAEAARHYFGKPPADLDLAESAFLAAIPQAPSRLNPRIAHASAKARQEWILRRCLRLGWIDADEHARAAAEPIRLQPPGRVFRAPHFAGIVLASANPGTQPGAVATTLDLPLQDRCEGIVRGHLAGLRGSHALQAAVVAIDNATGDVLALVGSPDWFDVHGGQVNGALARRSPGSALKPFVYLIALGDGATAADIVPDVPSEFPTPTGLFRPSNYDRHCRGPVSMREALACSLNIPAVRVLAAHGGPGRLRSLLEAWGIPTLDKPASHYGLGLALGDGEVRLLELAGAYATLARLGERVPLRCVPGPVPKPERVAPPEICWIIADILRDPAARAAGFGLETPLRTDFPLACKTGTSTGFRDNWAFGFTPEFTVGVWVGNFDGSPMDHVSGVAGAAPILHDVFVELHARFGTSWYARPDGVETARVGSLTGRRTAAGREEFFVRGRLPPGEDPLEHDAQGRVRLGTDYAEWFAGADNRLGGRAVLDDGAAGSLRILNPVPGTVYFVDADLPARAQSLVLRASAACDWHCATMPLERHGGRTEARLAPGLHRLEATGGPGRSATTWIEVRRL